MGKYCSTYMLLYLDPSRLNVAQRFPRGPRLQNPEMVHFILASLFSSSIVPYRVHVTIEYTEPENVSTY